MLGGKIKEMLEAEMSHHLGYEKSERSDSDNARNGHKSKRVISSYGNFSVEVPQDRKSTFAPQIIPKRQKDISDIDRKIISMYGRGLSTRQISDTLEELYGFEVSDSFVSDVTDKILPQIHEWQSSSNRRGLSGRVYRRDTLLGSRQWSRAQAGSLCYFGDILAINCDGHKEVLSIEIGENESAKYWLGVLNSLKNRRLKDILILCADGLTGLKDAVATAFFQTEFQRCIVHQVRNTLKYMTTKDRKNFAADLKKNLHGTR